MFFVRASGEALLGTLKYGSELCLLNLFRASGEAVIGTLRYLSDVFLAKSCSRLRRGDFRYTEMCF